MNAYLAFLGRLKAEKVPVEGVLLYGLARPSLQAEAVHVSALNAEWMEVLRDKIEAAGFPVKLTL